MSGTVVRHVAVVELADRCPDEDRDALLEDIRGLAGVVPGLLWMSAGTDLGNPRRICLVSDHTSAEDLAAYVQHPAHLKVAARVGDLMTTVAGADFPAPADAQ